MKKIWALVVVIGVLGSRDSFTAPVGNPLKDPEEGRFMIGYEETFLFDKNLKHSDYKYPHGYRSNQHMIKLNCGVLGGLDLNGEIGIGRIKNISLAVPHEYQLAWGAGVNLNIMKCMNNLWPVIPETLPYAIEIGINGRYIGIKSEQSKQTPTTSSALDINESWREFQAGAWIGRDFGPVTPYAGLILNWTEVKQKIESPGSAERTLNDPADIGYVLGFDLALGKCKGLERMKFLKDIELCFEFCGQSDRANSITAGINFYI